ncbi:MAG: response regulator [Bacteroidota bacterium]
MEDRKQILIIEDHDSIRLLLGKYLSKSYRVATRRDGLDAMSWLSRGNLPDLILLDREMPRINGLEFLINLRSSGLFRHIPVLLVTGEENPQQLRPFKRLGISGYIPKPFNPAKVSEAIYGILDQHPQALFI